MNDNQIKPVYSKCQFCENGHNKVLDKPDILGMVRNTFCTVKCEKCKGIGFMLNDTVKLTDKIVITKELDDGFDEMFCIWYKCPRCGDSHIADIFNFCPNCGQAVIVPEGLVQD